MHQIDGAGATAENTFTEGDAQQAIPATQVTADWLTAVQQELVAIAEHNGGVLNKEDNGQVLAKILEIAKEGQIGVAQTWQDLSASRSATVSYTNSSEKPILVAVDIYSTIGGSYGALLYVDDIPVSHHNDYADAASLNVTVCAIVPPDSVYRVELINASVIAAWRELR
ncbi:MAG: hypothetical protein ACRBB4_01380 [Neptuniibacter sp.]